MSRFLDTMASRSQQRAVETARGQTLVDMRRQARSAAPPRPLAGFGKVFDVIAEVKPRSPSEGEFPPRPPAATALLYQEGGAGMISVLTEPSEFGGSLEMLAAVSSAVSVPVLAKDFLVDPIQVYEARLNGADGVLLIARTLGDDDVAAILDAVEETGMFALIEGFEKDDMARIARLVADRLDLLVGVNCRDLDNLAVEPARHRDLAHLIPESRIAVAESAIVDPTDVARVAALGYRAALVGSALMRADDATNLVGEMVDTGRRAVVVAR